MKLFLIKRNHEDHDKTLEFQFSMAMNATII